MLELYTIECILLEGGVVGIIEIYHYLPCHKVKYGIL